MHSVFCMLCTTTFCVRRPPRPHAPTPPRPLALTPHPHANDTSTLPSPRSVVQTTIGQAIAADRGWRFVDADDLHDAACVAKMARGEPLTDQDRHDWLIRVHRLVREWSDGTLVIACSALKQSYRRLIARGESCVGPSHGATVKFVLLHTSRETVMRRLAARRNHFFKGSALLVDAQYDALEMSDELLIVQVDDDVAGGTAETTRRVLELL